MQDQTRSWKSLYLNERIIVVLHLIEKTNNLLGLEVNSIDVSELAAELCSPLFSKTTAAQIPIDGGNERVI